MDALTKIVTTSSDDHVPAIVRDSKMYKMGEFRSQQNLMRSLMVTEANFDPRIATYFKHAYTGEVPAEPVVLEVHQGSDAEAFISSLK